jgi:hypothetical protein
MTGIGRPLDFNYLTNRAAFFMTIAVVFSGTGYRMIGTGVGIQAVLWGLGAGTTIFFAWALGRELDPDNNPSAFIAAGLTLIGIFFWGIPNLGMLLWLLIAVRIVNRTTGLAPTFLDLVVFIGLGVWLSYRGYWIVGLMTAAGLLLDSRLPRGKRYQLFISAISAIASASALIWGNGLRSEMNISWITPGLGLLMASVFLPVIIGSCHIQSKMDKTGERMIPIRIQAGQSFASVFWILTAFWGGMNGITSLMPIWIAAVSAAIFHIFFRKRILQK